jgi:hypothetical protein
MGLIGCPETSVRNYYYLLRKNQEERTSLILPMFISVGLLFFGELRSQTLQIFVLFFSSIVAVSPLITSNIKTIRNLCLLSPQPSGFSWPQCLRRLKDVYEHSHILQFYAVSLCEEFPAFHWILIYWCSKTIQGENCCRDCLTLMAEALLSFEASGSVYPTTQY